MNLGAIRDVIGQVGTQISDRGGEVIPDAGNFLQDYITNKLPEFIIGAATKIAGREDGSGMFTNEVLKAGRDPVLGTLVK